MQINASENPYAPDINIEARRDRLMLKLQGRMLMPESWEGFFCVVHLSPRVLNNTSRWGMRVRIRGNRYFTDHAMSKGGANMESIRNPF